MTDKISIRRFEKDDAQIVADLIGTTLAVSNSKDYPPEYIKENIESHSAQVIEDRANESHFYVAVDGDTIIGCGGITGYWGSTTESYLVTIFVLPEYQHCGIGRKIIETLEADEYFKRAWRTEVGSSLTAVDFYRRLGYQYKNNVTTPDEFGVVRLEKITGEKPDEVSEKYQNRRKQNQMNDNQQMIGVYFSGTGNSRYAVEHFVKTYDKAAMVYSIEDSDVTHHIEAAEGIVFGYPVQYSNVPKIVKDFVDQNKSLWKGKKIFVIATMGLFSGDGAGILARRLEKHGAIIIGGLHLKMADSIADVKALKRPLKENQKLVALATQKIERAAEDTKNGKAPQEGIGFLYHMAGLFGQRLYFYNKTNNYSDQLKVNLRRCVGCGRCESACPTNNIRIENKVAVAKDRCTMCYRCINTCPKQAITLLGKSVVEQGTIEKYCNSSKDYDIRKTSL